MRQWNWWKTNRADQGQNRWHSPGHKQDTEPPRLIASFGTGGEIWLSGLPIQAEVQRGVLFDGRHYDLHVWCHRGKPQERSKRISGNEVVQGIQLPNSWGMGINMDCLDDAADEYAGVLQ